jgi:mannitol-1-/sugar-/sorbitol-6-phosphatase
MRPDPSPADTPELPSIAAVLFDMDGTLIDSDASLERACTDWSSEYGLPLTLSDTLARGWPTTQIIRRLFPELEGEPLTERINRFIELECATVNDVGPMPGAPALLTRLEALQIPWAIVTSAERPLATLRLQAAGLTAKTIITIDDVTAPKPDPEGYLLAARTLNVEISHCLVVEDSIPGVAAGLASGATVASLRGHTADLPLRDLHHLTELLAEPDRSVG